MESNPEGLKHRELTEKIIGVFYDVYNELGHGFLETTTSKLWRLRWHRRG
jgi:hypothetical protein